MNPLLNVFGRMSYQDDVGAVHDIGLTEQQRKLRIGEENEEKLREKSAKLAEKIAVSQEFIAASQIEEADEKLKLMYFTAAAVAIAVGFLYK